MHDALRNDSLSWTLSTLAPDIPPSQCRFVSRKRVGARQTTTYQLPGARFLKLAEQAGTTALLGKEIEYTRRAHARLASTSDLLAPAVLGETPERNAMLVRAVAGRPFNIWSPTVDAKSRRGGLVRIGRWFSAFHAPAAAALAEFDLAAEIAPFLSRAREEVQHARCAAPALLQIAAARLERHAETHPRLRLPHTLVHGDTTLNNILLGQASCGVIDFETATIRPSVFDLGGLLARVSLFPDESGHPPCPGADADALHEGYGDYFPTGPELRIATDITLFWLVVDLSGSAETLRPWQRIRLARLERRFSD